MCAQNLGKEDIVGLVLRFEYASPLLEKEWNTLISGMIPNRLRTESGFIARAPGPDLPPTMTQSMFEGLKRLRPSSNGRLSLTSS